MNSLRLEVYLHSNAGAIGSSGVVGETTVEIDVGQCVIVHEVGGSQFSCGSVFPEGTVFVVNGGAVDGVRLFPT